MSNGHDDFGYTPLDSELAKRVLLVLEEHFPGHGWDAYARGGMMTVTAESVTADQPKNRRFKMAIHTANLANAKVMPRKVIWAGGEYLERANLARSQYKGDNAGVLEQ